MSINMNPRIWWSTASEIIRALFYPHKEKKFPWLPILWIGLLTLAGLLLWAYFFNWGNVPFNFMDWEEVWAARMQAWRVALHHNTLPFHLQDLGAMRSNDDRYFAVADMVSSPQVLLLAFMKVGPYALINNLLLYGIATYSLILFRRKKNLSLIAFAIVFLLFQFNGFIVTHLSVGHLSWGGYYFFPAFFLLLLQLIEGEKSWLWVAKMGLVLFAIFLQGSFHHLVWCLILLALLAIMRWRSFFTILKAVAAGLLLSMPRILPVFSRVGGLTQELDFLGGFPSLAAFWHSLIYNASPDMALPGKVFTSVLGYWEFDLYVGWVGVAFILLFALLGGLIWHYRQRSLPYLLIGSLLLIALSISDNLPHLFFYNDTLTSMERVTSRMGGLALVILVLSAGITYQYFLNLKQQHWSLLILQIAALLLLAHDLVLHTLRWSVNNTSYYIPAEYLDLSRIQISNHADPPYFTAITIGVIISALTMAFLFWKVRKDKKVTAVLNGGLKEEEAVN